MRPRGSSIAATAALLAALFGASVAVAATGESARGGGVQLESSRPAGRRWRRRGPTGTDDPRTLLVIGTEGVQPTETDCLVSSYRVPSDGAVVVVIGWRDEVGGASFHPLGAMKLQRGTFKCFAGRGAFGRVVRRDRDFQVNVMVGDRADVATVEAAFDAARSIAPVARS